MTRVAEPLIEVRGLGARAGAATILDDIGFALPAGRIVTLFGPSGAGKTTIAAAVAGVRQPGVQLTGDIRHHGEIRVGYLPQNAAATLNPARRVGVALHELVGLERPRLPRAQRRARVAQILATAAFDVADADRDAVLRRYPFEFSGGERARLALAQVLAVRPDVLVIDEPTVGLDPLARAALLRSLATLRGQGAAILLVTHDPVAERAGDRTLYVHGGRIVEELPPEPVASEPGGKPTAAPSAPVLRLRGVTVTLHRRRILHEIDLAVRAGELLAILGVSGAGKSTIARCMAGLVAPRHGAVLLDDQPLPVLRRRSRAQIAQVQYVWQESASSFDPRRPVLDQVAATAVRLRGLARDAARAEAADTLADLGLAPEQLLRRPAGLSGGQLQRAALARALLARPRVLLCDEITTALDEPTAARIHRHLDAYRRRTGAAIVAIGHDLPGQLDRADRVALVDAGRLVDLGPPARLLAQPRTPLLADLLAAESPPGQGT
ncbi:ABC transporter ATP-binding protein [Nocardia farcinica]|uniref:ABC transporter ATP-binding protein n=1 Tax=Nocardia farcinica TaxID=37329 RepID=UPI00378FFD27